MSRKGRLVILLQGVKEIFSDLLENIDIYLRQGKIFIDQSK